MGCFSKKLRIPENESVRIQKIQKVIEKIIVVGKELFLLAECLQALIEKKQRDR